MKAVVTCVSVLAAGALLAPSAGAQVSGLEVLTQGAGGEQAEFDTEYLRSTPDLSRVYFETQGSLLAEDVDDNDRDIYEATGMQTRLISTGPTDDHFDAFYELNDVSTDGSRIYFTTNERLIEADGDEGGTDVYARIGEQVLQVSRGATEAVPDQVNFDDATADGSRAWFGTYERLVPEDEDDWYDIYEWNGVQGEVELVSTGPLDTPDVEAGDEDMDYEDATPDGTQVFFNTRLALTADDTDEDRDVYRRAGGETTLVTPDPVVDDGTFVEVGVYDVSADGTRVYINTTVGLVTGDDDGVTDFYVLTDGEPTLLTPGTGYGGEELAYEGRTGGGARVYFSTPERLVDADTDASIDVYEYANGQTSLLSTGPEAEGGNFEVLLSAFTNDGSRLILRTDEALTGDDGDENRDLYVRENGALTLLSDKGEGSVSFDDMSDDGTRVVYSDDDDNVFVNDGGPSVELLSHAGEPLRLSPDGSRLLLETPERLVAQDTDNGYDTYRMTLAQPPRNTARPAITGTPTVGRALACSTGTWSGDEADYAYAWNRNGSPIAGATTATYTAAPPDANQQLTCTVTATNAIGAASATSAAVTVRPAGGPPPPPPPPAGPAPGPCANPQTGSGAAETLTGTDAGDLLRGLAGDDELIGLAGADCLTGGAGDDRLSGGAGADRLAGSKGDDRLVGGRGADRLIGGGGADALTGGKGADRLKGDAGVDRLTGGGGDDVILAADGEAETVRCGAGAGDRVVADPGDRLRGCERKRRVS